jgi:hypothetical protein
VPTETKFSGLAFRDQSSTRSTMCTLSMLPTPPNMSAFFCCLCHGWPCVGLVSGFVSMFAQRLDRRSLTELPVP